MKCHATGCKNKGVIERQISKDRKVYYCEFHNSLIFTKRGMLENRSQKKKAGVCPNCGKKGSSNNKGWGKFCNRFCYQEWYSKIMKPMVDYRNWVNK